MPVYKEQVHLTSAIIVQSIGNGLGRFLCVAADLNQKKINEKGLKTLSFNDKDKIKGKVNSTRFDFLV